MKMVMNGYILQGNIRGSIPLNNLKSALNFIEGKTGVFYMENIEAKEEVDPENLTLYLENGKYLLMLLDYDDEGYIDIRTSYNPSKGKGTEIILGEPYGKSSIIEDFSVIRRAFFEFEKTGNVTTETLI